MALDKATLKTAIEAAINAQWAAGDLTTLKTDVKAAFDVAFAVTDPTQAAASRQACADAIGAAVHKYVHGSDGVRIASLATALSNALDTYVKTATITIGPLHAGLQTSTAIGAPTAGPALPVPITGAVS